MSGHVTVWEAPEAQANDILRAALRQAKYKYAYRKLNNARWHIIETHTRRIPEDEWTRKQTFVANGDVPDA